MYEAYCRIFDRCGLPYVIVEAESGPIGGDVVARVHGPLLDRRRQGHPVPACGYAANQERAEIGADAGIARQADPDAPPYQAVADARTSGRSARSASSSRSTSRPRPSCWSILADGKPVAALLAGRPRAERGQGPPGDRRGDAGRRPTRPRSRRRPEPRWVSSARSAIKIPLVIDRAIAAMPTVVVGGNAVDVHLKGVVPGRDFPLEQVHDLRNADAGDPCPRCGKPLEITAGLEIGHVFKLGTKYSKAMGATYLDEKGNEIPSIMGCYGIGINRIVAGGRRGGPRRQRDPLAARAGPLSGRGRPAPGPERGRDGAAAERSKRR